MSPTLQCVTRVEDTVDVGEYDGVIVVEGLTVPVCVTVDDLVAVAVDTPDLV